MTLQIKLMYSNWFKRIKKHFPFLYNVIFQLSKTFNILSYEDCIHNRKKEK